MQEGPFKPSAEDLVGEEWAEWYRMGPLERWQESAKLWQTYVALGGVPDPEHDTRSPFFDGGACWTVYSGQKRLVPAANFVHYVCTPVFPVILQIYVAARNTASRSGRAGCWGSCQP